MKKDLNSIILTPQEFQIMKVVWEMGAASVRNVFSVISKRKEIAYTTVLTMMNILESKGVLTHTKSGRAFIYRPVLTRERAMYNQVHDVLDRFFDGDPQKLIENILKSNIVDLHQKERAAQHNIKVLL